MFANKAGIWGAIAAAGLGGAANGQTAGPTEDFDRFAQSALAAVRAVPRGYQSADFNVEEVGRKLADWSEALKRVRAANAGPGAVGAVGQAATNYVNDIRLTASVLSTEAQRLLDPNTFRKLTIPTWTEEDRRQEALKRYSMMTNMIVTGDRSHDDVQRHRTALEQTRDRLISREDIKRVVLLLVSAPAALVGMISLGLNNKIAPIALAVAGACLGGAIAPDPVLIGTLALGGAVVGAATQAFFCPHGDKGD